MTEPRGETLGDAWDRIFGLAESLSPELAQLVAEARLELLTTTLERSGALAGWERDDVDPGDD